jgi:hypothetical protein
MPFPFLPLGWLLAVAVLVAALTVFGLVLRAMDRAVTRATGELRTTVLPGLVTGLRQWQPAPPRRGAAVSAASASPGGIEIVELVGSPPAREA